MNEFDPGATSNLAEQKRNLILAACRDHRLAPLDVRVLVVLVDHVHRQDGPDFGLMWPSAGTLAECGASSRRSVLRSLTKLSSLAYILPVRRGGGRTADGRGQSNVYRLPTTVPDLATLPDLASLTVPDSVCNGAKSGMPTVPDLAHNPIDITSRRTIGGAEEDLSLKPSSADILPFLGAPSTKNGAQVKKPAKRAKSARPLRQDNLALLDAYQPTPEWLARLREKAPNVAPRLDLLLEQFKNDEYYRGGFAAGKYCDPARTFLNFVLHREGIARDRNGVGASPVAQAKKPKVLVAGTPEARRAYDLD